MPRAPFPVRGRPWTVLLLLCMGCRAEAPNEAPIVHDLARELSGAAIRVEGTWRIGFDSGAEGPGLLASGWGPATTSSGRGVSEGTSSTITFSGRNPAPTRLRFRAAEPRCGRGPQAVDIALNGHELGSARFTRVREVHELLVQPGILRRADGNLLRFDYEYACPEDGRSAVWDWISLEATGDSPPAAAGRTAAGKSALELTPGTELSFVIDLPGDAVLRWDHVESLSEGTAPALRIEVEPAGVGEVPTVDRTLRPEPGAGGVELGDLRGVSRLRLAAGEGGVRLVFPRVVGSADTLPDRIVPPARNAILISIDTLRADHLEVYGYPKPTSPQLTRFRKDAALFRQAFAHGPSTFISHASLFTSRIPQHHGASFARGAELAPENLTLAEVLSDAGWATAGFTGGGQLSPAFGLAQGYQIYDSGVGGEHFDAVVTRGLEWVDGLGQRPFFLFLHTYEVHHPYDPRPEDLARFDADYTGTLPDTIDLDPLGRAHAAELNLDEEDLAHVVAAYDGLILSVDRALGRLVRELRERQLYDQTAIVFTSDHGEEFGEHGAFGWHSHTLYDELLHVPLLVKMAGGSGAGADVDRQVRLLDVAPTVLELLGISPPPDFTGESLVPAALGHRFRPGPVVGAIDSVTTRTGIRHDGWKWFEGKLFDLERDPNETEDLAAREPDRALQLERLLTEIENSRPAIEADAAELDAATIRELRALGYLD